MLHLHLSGEYSRWWSPNTALPAARNELRGGSGPDAQREGSWLPVEVLKGLSPPSDSIRQKRLLIVQPLKLALLCAKLLQPLELMDPVDPLGLLELLNPMSLLELLGPLQLLELLKPLEVLELPE